MDFTLGDGVFSLSEEETHHVRKVLRARSGDILEVVDANGSLFAAELREGSEATVLEKLKGSEEKRPEVALYQVIPKGKHMDLLVEKSTELSVDVIVPLMSERSVVRLDAGDGKVGRWRRLAESAARQSLQLKIPEVTEPAPFEKALQMAKSDGILLHNEDGLPPLEEKLRETSVSLFVGPEGGWSDGELDLARSTGLHLASLGPYRLRSETAGIVAAARARAALDRVVK